MSRDLLERLERARLALRSIDEDELEDAVLDAMDYITGHTVRQAVAALEKARNDPNTKWTPITRADLKGDDWAARLEAQIDFEHSPEGKAHYQALFRGDVPRGASNL